MRTWRMLREQVRPHGLCLTGVGRLQTQDILREEVGLLVVRHRGVKRLQGARHSMDCLAQMILALVDAGHWLVQGTG